MSRWGKLEVTILLAFSNFVPVKLCSWGTPIFLFLTWYLVSWRVGVKSVNIRIACLKGVNEIR